MRKHNLTIDKVIQHNRWDNKKNCPAELRSGEWGVDWNEYIALAEKYFGMINPEKPTAEQIIKTLSGKVNISSPDYWVAVLNGKEAVNLEHLNTLFTRLAGY